MASNVCWGIEIGSHALSAIKLEASGDQLSVRDFVILPHAKVLSTPGVDQNDGIRFTLGAFMSQYDLGGATVAVSIPGHAALARFAKLPPVDPKKIPDIVKFEAVQQIPFPIEEVEWDYQTFQSPDSPDVEVGIFAVTREKINERLSTYQELGLVPDIVTLAPVAAYNAMAYDMMFTEQTSGTILLDVGTTSTDLVIAEAGRVWVRTFPIGGHHFTDALVKAFELSYAKAEKLKREAETSKYARHVFQAMRPVFSDLAQEVQRSIGYYQLLHKEAQLTRLIGMGSTFNLPGLRKFLKQQLGLDAQRVEGFKRISMEGPRAQEFAAAALNLVPAYGLAIQGLGRHAIRANLMPVAMLREAMWKRKVKWFGVAAGVAFAACGAMFIRPFLDSQAVAANPRPPVIDEAARELTRLKNEAGEVVGGAPLDPAAANTLALLSDRAIFAQVMADFGAMLEASDRVAQSWEPQSKAPRVGPAYWLEDFKATYIAPGQGVALELDQPLTEGDSAPAHIQIDLILKTTQPEPRKFVLASAWKWLGDNALRDGVPYRLIRAKRWEVPDEVVIADPTKKDQAAPPGQSPPRDRLALGNEDGGGGGKGGASGAPRSGRNRQISDEERERIMREDSIIPEGAIVTGASDDEVAEMRRMSAAAQGGGGGSGGYGDKMPGLDQIKQMAKLPERPPVAPPGAKLATVKLTYIIELAVPKAGEEGRS